MQVFSSHYIAGHWVAAQSPESVSVHDSSSEEVIATVPAGTADEAARAVQAARGAFEAWSRLSADTRAGYLDKISAGLKGRMDEMATIIAREVGMPLKLARSVQVLRKPAVSVHWSVRLTASAAWRHAGTRRNFWPGACGSDLPR